MPVINLPADSNSVELITKIEALIEQSEVQHFDLKCICEQIVTQLRILNMYMSIITNNKIEEQDL